MMERDDEQMRSLLKQAMPPMADEEPQRDLWPAMRARMTARPALPHWFDWALACSVLGFALAFPAAIPILLYCM
jgi:hypothetical protein